VTNDRFEAVMTTRQGSARISTGNTPLSIAQLIHAAIHRGLIIDRAVKIGAVRGVVIGYNIARRGRFPGLRFPLLVKTELGTAKFSLDEVVAA
jgi:hypothetical protein